MAESKSAAIFRALKVGDRRPVAAEHVPVLRVAAWRAGRRLGRKFSVRRHERGRYFLERVE